jgi:outer membrane protein TolC
MNKSLIILALLLLPLFLFYGLCLASESNNDIMTLQMAIDLAIENNTLIREAIERQKAAMEAEKSARADFFPKASVTYSYTRLDEAPFSYFQTALGKSKIDVGEKDNFHWDITVTQPLFTGFSLSTLHKMAKLGIDIAALQKEEAVLDVSEQVKLAYFNILLAKKMVLVAEEEVEQLAAHEMDAEKFYKEGMIPFNDLLKSKVALAQAVQNLTRARSDMDVAVASLNTILRREIDKKTEVEDILEIRPQVYILPDLYREALRKRPGLKALRVSLKNAQYQVGLARSSFYPQIALVGRYERNGDNPDASNNDFGNYDSGSVTFQVTWNFFEWGKKVAETRKAIYEKRSLEEKLKRLEDQVKLQVKQAYSSLRVAEKNINTATEALAQAKENFRITNLRYQQQMTTSTEVLDARAFLTQAEANYYRALYGYRMALAELERALGRK